MNWILVTYLLVLVYLATHKDRFPVAVSLKPVWITFCLIPISRFFFAAVAAGNTDSTHDLALVQIWENGFEWLLLGISFYYLTPLFERHENTRPLKGNGKISGMPGRSDPG